MSALRYVLRSVPHGQSLNISLWSRIASPFSLPAPVLESPFHPHQVPQRSFGPRKMGQCADGKIKAIHFNFCRIHSWCDSTMIQSWISSSSPSCTNKAITSSMWMRLLRFELRTLPLQMMSPKTLLQCQVALVYWVAHDDKSPVVHLFVLLLVPERQVHDFASAFQMSFGYIWYHLISFDHSAHSIWELKAQKMSKVSSVKLAG